MSDIENQPIEPVLQVEATDSPATQQVDTERMGKAFAGVKKEYRQKGYNEGYATAREELKREEQVAAASHNSSTVNIDIEKVSDQLAQKAAEKLKQNQLETQHKNFLNNIESVNNKALKKYDDFQSILDNAETQARTNKTFADLGAAVYETKDVELLHKVFSDASVREKLLDMPRDKWQDKFSEILKSAKLPKMPESPIDRIRSTPATGDINLTFEQKAIRSKKEAQIKRF